MKRSIILGAIAIIAIAVFTTFLSSVSASSDSTNRTKTTSIDALAASTTLVISQAYGGGGGTTGTYLNDYVEIKNVSATSQSLTGLSLYYGSSTGQFASSATNAYALTGTTLASGKYYLVQLSSAGTAGAPLPVTPDESSTNLAMSGTNGKVALVNGLTVNSCGATATPCSLPNAQIIDLVSWGVANNAEGGAATNGGVALTSVQGNVRKTNGCTDTDNNNADFDIVTAPVPRNSATAAAPCGSTSHVQHVMDFNGDGKSDFSVIRHESSAPDSQLTWYNCYSGVAAPACYQFAAWGLFGDKAIPADFDGDGKTDIAVWRPGASGVAGFYILQSSNGTVRFDNFGQNGDDPNVVADYTGDGKADPAVYRDGLNTGNQSYWYYRASSGPLSGSIVFEPWGQNADRPVPGDYDGDGKSDLMIRRGDISGQLTYWLRTSSTNNVSVIPFGLSLDYSVPGDYDGDGKTDLAVARDSGGLNWIYRSSLSGNVVFLGAFGSNQFDYVVQGDYDGDGKTDIAVWRPTSDASPSNFYVMGSTSGFTVFPWGSATAFDYPVAHYNIFY